MERKYDIYESDLLGPVGIVMNEDKVEEIFLRKENLEDYLREHPDTVRDLKRCKEVKKQLEEYFQGKRLIFELPMLIEGTPFRATVWQVLNQIPYGETRSYKEIAEAIGSPKAARAVGGASRANHLPLLIPCHRVVGSTGKLVGFMGKQIEIKEQLLAHEQAVLAKINK